LLDLFHSISINDVPGLDVVVAGNCHATLVALANFADTLQGMRLASYRCITPGSRFSIGSNGFCQMGRTVETKKGFRKGKKNASVD
jgi:hypothetical protein